MSASRRRLPCASLLLFFAGCGGAEEPPKLLAPPPPGLKSTPKWLTYTCVEPGCVTELTATVEVIGVRDVAIKRVVLSDRDRDDFGFELSQQPPFVMKAGQPFSIAVTYAPTGDPRLGDVELRVTYTDASASESPDRIPPGELAIPLVRRLVGEPKLGVAPEQLVFGPVLPTAERTLPLTVRNDGFGNVGLVFQSITTDRPTEIRVGEPPPAALVPGESYDLPVTYAPAQEGFLEGLLTVRPVDSDILPTFIPLLGTSIGQARIAVTPAGGVDFGAVPVAGRGGAVVQVMQRGGEPLVGREVELGSAPAAADLEVALEGGVRTATVAPLDSLDIELTLAGRAPGEIGSHLRIHSNDRQQPVIDVPVVGLITQPQIRVDPTVVDFGNVPRGWSVVRSVEVSNAGYGDLVISNVTMIFGSSELFTLRTVPRLPITLRHAQRIGLEVEFRSEAEAAFQATLSIDSNDAQTPFVEIGFSAAGASCELGCPIANGTPSCTGGICAVGRCNQDWYDTDRDPANGCECREIGRDPGAFCADSHYMGRLADRGDRASFTGVLPTEEDVDVLRFFAADEFSFGSDRFDVRVNLESTDPNIRFCIYRHNTGSHLNECFFENESCPENRSYRRSGSSGPDDSADFIIRVHRRPGVGPTCTPYTVFVGNG